MRVFNWQPVGALADHVERIWGWESDPGETVRLPILLPGTGAELFFHYREPFSYHDAGCDGRLAPIAHTVCGRRKSIALSESPDVGFIAVRIRAGSVHHVLDCAPGDLADTFVPLQALWGRRGRALTGEVMAAGGDSDRAGIIAGFLAGRLAAARGDELVRQAVRQTYRACSACPIPSIAEGLGLSQRQLERRVRQATGQSLVEIRRASRFQKAVRHLLLNREAGIVDSAMAQGFYDQSHFARLFKGFGLTSPGSFIRRARSMSNFYNPPAR